MRGNPLIENWSGASLRLVLTKRYVDANSGLAEGIFDQSTILDQRFLWFLARSIQISLSQPTLLLCLPMAGCGVLILTVKNFL